MSNLIFQKRIFNFDFYTLDGPPNFPVNFLRQVHGVDFISCPSEGKHAADGFIVDKMALINSEEAYAILTADCLPLLFVGDKIVFLHAGWRGLHQNIITTKTVKENLPTYLFIGPHIKSCCYEVSPAFVKNFADPTLFLKRNQNGQERIFFDMEQFVIRTASAAFKNIDIISSNICTCCSKSFHSYRKDGTTARNWNIISSKIRT
ncbi:MAG: hypothetical protein A2504_03610 [Bdellovibrionales bacterium RIFOXYD12_FULL_39_22]|nr:MAG: hypothetical protein A2385_11360 [Bdellovibrionales bacterium RIFOXYB1_FULL_39_21]OFZ41665.1 MAG: hypothetical protein A2485_01670 [Bdellovibrionales bacterium RIFOXYC12_FULL_39_17]OFZ46065.1 MAG: hypothetical protein A2404_12035 [Bdellovibrionales bacterium RIFOXYC1_FULL_39_130]OFZ69128.1 MAG: hypothetical protein A2451_14775 [Bdellovibrionales bacterium RIFOXYC2_FULL_39_8]OFZ74892.1 MAG: hypothetical protein A2560_15075 [Bdellovibrionales bacterium RIFOXYD1_FULL_39_84]OFZ92745.1 MAG: